jgi:hypothetical protein
MGGSLELWFPISRAFPRAPVLFALPENSVVFFERLLAVVLAASLVLTIISRRWKIFSLIAAAALAVLIFFDQTRLQPWVFQYWLLIVVLAFGKTQAADEDASRQTLSLVQISIAALYFWSGAQKLNYTFAHETLPKLLAPLENLFPAVQIPFVFLGVTIALIESLTGIGLLFRKTRRVAVCAAIATHLVILTLLVARNYNHIVWIWNAALVAIVLFAFWRSEISLKPSIRTAGDWREKLIKTIVAASVLLPALSFFGFWDMFLSGALYSGNVEVAVIRTDENLFAKLPPKAQAVVFQTKNGGERMLPLVEWSIAETRVPVYPERRVFRQVFGEVCRLAGDESKPELIIKERPAIFDGSYKVARIDCAGLEKR